MADTKQNIYQRLIQAKSNFTAVGKRGHNKFQNYKYATLDDILDMVTPILSECGLLLIQEVNDNGVNTYIISVEGEKIESGCMQLADEDKKGNSPSQNIGTAITYLKRYQISALLGISTDEDTDARKQPQQQQPKQQNGKETEVLHGVDSQIFKDAYKFVQGKEDKDKALKDISARCKSRGYKFTQEAIDKFTELTKKEVAND